MTFSILAKDPDTGAFGGAAATGSLCVGGWVLRGDLRAGMSASQGSAPSTFWGEEVLQQMGAGLNAGHAVKQVTSRDNGREHRQLSALDLHGTTGAYTGAENHDTKGSLEFPDGIAAGNMLGGNEVLPAMVEAFSAANTSFAQRLLESLTAARDAGGDYRGLLSAALLVLHPEQSPLTLRIDIHEEDPIDALHYLYQKATTGEYGQWVRRVPVSTDTQRC